MFGFARVNTPDLTEEEKLRYRAVYCGLCRELGARCGQVARLSVNHDLVFCALLRMSLYEPRETARSARCAVHPLEAQAYTACDEIAYAADMSVALMHGKCADDWRDDANRRARRYGRALARPYAAVSGRWPRQCATLEGKLSFIEGLEERAASGEDVHPDEAASAFGDIMGEIMVRDEDFWSGDLRRFGRALGRAIYLLDAAVDCDDDAGTGSYNPFSTAHLTEDEQRTVVGASLAEATSVFERLPLVQDAHLLRSVLYAGMWAQANDARNRRRAPMPQAEEAMR